MNIRFLCVFIFLMCALAAGIADAHTLHVGNKSFPLFQTKYSSPSLAFGIGNETWYAPMTRVFINDSLHLKIDSTTYSVINCAEGFVDTENYTYDANGRLIGADEDLYLQSTGTQYIDTEFYASPLSKAEMDFRLGGNYLSNEKSWSFFGYYPGDYQNSSQSSFAFSTMIRINGDNLIQSWLEGYIKNKANSAMHNITDAELRTKRRYILDAKNKKTTYAGVVKNTPSRYTNSTAHTVTLFGITGKSGQRSSFHRYEKTYLYNTKLYDNEVLLRHFVPVPACMRIGDFVVPENGMWDIVEQKFYGNSGTGSFIYGKDE